MGGHNGQDCTTAAPAGEIKTRYELVTGMAQRPKLHSGKAQREAWRYHEVAFWGSATAKTAQRQRPQE
eukprot:815052-Karenia_brevis.AAC.1